MNNTARIGGPRALAERPDMVPRRLAILWLAAWMGMCILIQLFTVVGFDTTASLAAAPPACYTSAVRLAGQPLIHELLGYQAAENSRSMLDLWGWLQLGLAAGLFLLLLLFSSAGKLHLGIALALLADAGLLCGALIPKLDDFERQLAVTPPSQSLAFLMERSRLANVAFTVSQSVTLILCLALLVLLLRRGHAARARAVL
jgi:hypothetical protein